MSWQDRAILQVAVDKATAATHEIIAAVSGQKIYIMSIWLWAAGIVDVTPQSAAMALSGKISMVAQSEFFLDFNLAGEPWFTCTQGDAFNLVLGQAVQVSGRIYYVQAP